MTCARCNKNIDKPIDYGGYVIIEVLDLCIECWDKWITMRKEHYYKEQEFLSKGGG